MPRNTAPAMDQIPYRLPLVIGATGHRDLRDQDIPALERTVADVIERVKCDYLRDRCWVSGVPALGRLCRQVRPSANHDTPIVVLSALAEGADRLIARVAMAKGAKLIVPLPMPAEEYRPDFIHDNGESTVAEFDGLLAQAVSKPVMPWVAGNSSNAVKTDLEKRALQYREAGLFIVRHCHLLIALWDGDENDAAVGGTAEIVTSKCDGIPFSLTASARASLDASEIGPVVHIRTPRSPARDGADVVNVDRWGTDFIKHYRGGSLQRRIHGIAKTAASLIGIHLPAEESPRAPREKRQLEAWEAFAAQTALTRRFNDEAASLKGSPQLADSLRRLFAGPEQVSGDESASGESAKRSLFQLAPQWGRLYQTADTLAQRWHDRFVRDWRGLFLLAFVAAVVFEVLTHIVFDKHVDWKLLGLYSFMFILVFTWFFYARWRQDQERFLDYRALAEALRVGIFWKLIGVALPGGLLHRAESRSSPEMFPVDSVADAYPIRQPRELDWVKTCLRTLELLELGTPPTEPVHQSETDRHLWARTLWVHGQLRFFHERVVRYDRRAEMLETHARALLILSIAFALALAILDSGLFDALPKWSHEDYPHRAFIFLIGIYPALAAVVAGYAERLALKAQVRHYDRMRVLFERAHDILQSEQLKSFQEAQALYAELGREAMNENAEWAAIYRQRPIQPP
jgi:CheY-like chemotaxis protein